MAGRWRIFHYFFILGFGLLLPWNVILNCIPSFRASLLSSSGGGSAYYATYYAFFCPLAFNFLQLPTQILVLFGGDRLSIRVRAMTGYAIQVVILGVLPFSLSLGVVPVLIGCVLSGMALATIESALFGAAGMLGGEAAGVGVRAILQGEGAAAVLSSLLQLALQADPSLNASEWTVRVYFIIAATFLVGCIALMPLALALKAKKRKGSMSTLASQVEGGASVAVTDAKEGYAEIKSEEDDDDDEEEEEVKEVKEEEEEAVEGGKAAHLLNTERDKNSSSSSINNSSSSSIISSSSTSINSSSGMLPVLSNGPPKAPRPPSPLSLKLIFRGWPTILSIFSVTFLSFAVFPGAIAGMAYSGAPSDFYSRAQDSWTLLLFLLFNGGDLAGRWLAGGLSCCGCGSGWALRTRALGTALYNLSRVIFLPAFYYASRPGSAPSFPGGPTTMALLVLLFGITNGHAATLAMVIGPEQYPRRDKERAATIHVLCLIAGLCAGSSVGVAFAA